MTVTIIVLLAIIALLLLVAVAHLRAVALLLRGSVTANQATRRANVDRARKLVRL